MAATPHGGHWTKDETLGYWTKVYALGVLKQRSECPKIREKNRLYHFSFRMLDAAHNSAAVDQLDALKRAGGDPHVGSYCLKRCSQY